MNADRINEHYYGDPSDPKTERARARVHWMCGQAFGKDVLDVGCSQGIVSLILGREGFHCAGVDLEEDAIAVAEAALLKEDPLVRKRVNFRVADASCLPFEAASFDTVILGEILEHLTHPEKVLAEALRVLRGGGRAIVTVPYGLNAFHDHKRSYYPNSLLSLLQPHLRTEVIDTLNNYVVYRGTKDAAYSLEGCPPMELYATALRMGEMVEARCLEKERELLNTSVKLHQQARTLAAESTAQRHKMEALKADLEMHEQKSADYEEQLQALRQAAEAGTAEEGASAVRQVAGPAFANQEAASIHACLKKLQSSRAQDRRRIEELTDLLGKAQAGENAARALMERQTVEHATLLEKHVAESVHQAHTIRQLEQLNTNDALRIQELQRALEDARRASAELRAAHEDQIHSLQDRLHEQGAWCEQAEARWKAQQQETLTARQAAHDTVQQIEQLRERLRQADQKLSLRAQEVETHRKTADQLQGRCDGLQQKLQALQSQLLNEKESVRKEFQAVEARLSRDLRAKDSALKDLNALLKAREEDHKGQLVAAARNRDVDWERRLMNQRIRALVRDNTPPDARVLVISKGDEDLVLLDGRQGQHFPQTERGVYAGYHPGTAREAIEHLEALRTQGAQYLLIPQTSFWWLDFYSELREHLEQTASLVAFHSSCGALYHLTAAPTEPALSVRVKPRRNGQPSRQPPPTTPDIPPPQPPSAAAAPHSTHAIPTAPPRSPAQLAVILDEFTMGCLAPECRVLTFRPDNWGKVLQQQQPEALFVESAWRGNDGAWLYRVAQYARNMGNELAELLRWTQQHGIPSIFWNKEDPVHFERFIERAKLFSHIFTTDADCIQRYRESAGHDRVFALPFAAQPTLHNPVHDSSRTGQVCFAGTYYGARHEQRQIDMDYVLRPAIPFGLDIYDRQHGVAGKGAQDYRFPDIYQPCIKGRLDYQDMVRAYRRYRVFLNVNSVKQSPTMFSRRVFELLACGTPVVSTYSRGIVELLGDDIVFITESEADTRSHLERLLGNEEAWAKASTRGIRKVMQAHTYGHRLQEVFKQAGLPYIAGPETRFTLVVPVASELELPHLAQQLQAQTYRNFDIALSSDHALPAATVEALGNAVPHARLITSVGNSQAHYANAVGASNSDYFAFLCPGDFYGPGYLMDYSLAIAYSGADFLGKHTCFRQQQGTPTLHQPGHEYRWVMDVPSSSVIGRKAAMSEKDFRSALHDGQFRRSQGPILSIDRFNYVRLTEKDLSRTECSSWTSPQLQEVVA